MGPKNPRGKEAGEERRVERAGEAVPSRPGGEEARGPRRRGWSVSLAPPLSSEYGTYKTVTALFFRSKTLQHVTLFPILSGEACERIVTVDFLPSASQDMVLGHLHKSTN